MRMREKLHWNVPEMYFITGDIEIPRLARILSRDNPSVRSDR
jgi:hypothetical protein